MWSTRSEKNYCHCVFSCLNVGKPYCLLIKLEQIMVGSVFDFKAVKLRISLTINLKLSENQLLGKKLQKVHKLCKLK